MVAVEVEALALERLPPHAQRLQEAAQQLLLGIPNWPQNCGRKPRETVVTSRPRDRLSITANCSAAFIGCTSVSTNVNVPSITRDGLARQQRQQLLGAGNAHAGAPWRSGACTE